MRLTGGSSSVEPDVWFVFCCFLHGKINYRPHLYKRINSEKYINKVLKNVGVVAESLMRQDADIHFAFIEKNRDKKKQEMLLDFKK